MSVGTNCPYEIGTGNALAWAQGYVAAAQGMHDNPYFWANRIDGQTPSVRPWQQGHDAFVEVNGLREAHRGHAVKNSKYVVDLYT